MNIISEIKYFICLIVFTVFMFLAVVWDIIRKTCEYIDNVGKHWTDEP